MAHEYPDSRTNHYPFFLGGGLRGKHAHMAHVRQPVLKGNGNNGTCEACVAIDYFIQNELLPFGWEITRKLCSICGVHQPYDTDHPFTPKEADSETQAHTS